MKRRTFLATVLVCAACARSKLPRPPSFGSALAALEKGAQLGVAVLDTGNEAIDGHRMDQRFAMCSTFKLPLAAMVLHAADRGQLRLDAKVRYGASDMIDHAPVTGLHLERGSMSIEALAKAAQTTSDNVAANLLLRELGGPAAFTRFCRSLGDPFTRLDRNEPTLNDVVHGDRRDTTTPRAMAQLLATILNGSVLTPTSRARLIQWMRETTTGTKRLRAGLPSSWRTGDKTGTRVGAGFSSKYNDVACAWPPNRSPIIVTSFYDTMIESNEPHAQHEAVLAHVGKLIARTYQPNKPTE